VLIGVRGVYPLRRVFVNVSLAMESIRMPYRRDVWDATKPDE
jgi:hypothetical protein